MLPTTHILKVPDRDHPRDAAYEAAALQLSRALDIATAEAACVELGGIHALLVRRFDRALDAQGRILRLHQEDFAHALGLPAALKYERHGRPARRFDTTGVRRLLDATVNPVAARDAFIAATLFDLIIGNTDAHAKNHAILHLGRDAVHLAPRYDLLPTRLDANLTDALPFRIGSATRLADMTRQDFEAFLEGLGVVTPAARRRITAHRARVLADGLSGSLADLTDNGMKPLADLIAANMRHILPLLGVTVPMSARERDAFIPRGGGWLDS